MVTALALTLPYSISGVHTFLQVSSSPKVSLASTLFRLGVGLLMSWGALLLF